MPLRLLFLVALLGLPAGAAETSVGPESAVRSLALPSTPFASNLSGMTRWLNTSEGLKTAVGVDAELGLLGAMSPQAQASAATQIESYVPAPSAAKLAAWDELSEGERAALLQELSTARKSAAPGAVSALRERIKLAAANGAPKELLERLRAEADGYRIFGAGALNALTGLDGLIYQQRLSPIEDEARRFAHGNGAEDLTLGAYSSSGGTLARSVTPDQTHAPAPPAPKKPDLKIRALTAALIVPTIIGLIHLGGAAFIGFTVLLAGLSLREYATMLQKGGRPVQPLIAIGSAVALALTVALHGPLAPVIVGVTMLAALRELLRADHSFERAAHTVFGALLFGFLPAHLALVRGFSPFGERIALMLFASAWLTDTTAYFFGRRWGHRKIAPDISPNKTWEGAAAGFLGGLAAVLGIWATAPAMMPFWAALAIGLIMGVAGQASGYLNSMIKRANGVKDSGNLLPGHGGIIDRFDTFVLSAALVYYLLALI